MNGRAWAAPGFFLLLLLLVQAGVGWAATYTLPGGPLPSGCTASGAVVTCAAPVVLDNNDVVDITAPPAVTWNVGGLDADANNIHINASQDASHLDIVSSGAITIKNGVVINANIRSVGNIEIKNNGSLTGDIYGEANVIIGQNATINGDIFAEGMVTLGNGAVVTGSCLQLVTQPVPGCNPPPSSLHHVRIEHGSSGLTCQREAVTFRACVDAGCTSLYTGGNVAFNLSPTDQWYATATGGAFLTNPQIIPASGVLTLYLQQPSAATVNNVNVTLTGGPVPSGLPKVTCNNDTTTAPCSIVFTDAGLIFTETLSGGEATIPSQTAGIAFPTAYYLRAVKDENGACAAAVQGSRNVTLSYSCVDPATCAGSYMTMNGGTAFGSAGTSANLTFDSNGYSTTAMQFNYLDVGKIKLNASTTSQTGGSLAGSSNDFVVKPYGFTVIACPAAGPATCTVANNSLLDGTGDVFAKAGDTFKATITAIAAGGTVTPSFGRGTGNGTEAVALSHTLKAPTGQCGGSDCPATLGGTTPILRSGFTAGVATVPDLAWSEVGVITLTVTNTIFLGTGTTASGTSGNIGRFIPDHFVITSPSMTAACSTATAFTYFGQDGFTTVFDITAEKAGGGATRNYAGSWARLTLTDRASYGFTAPTWVPSQPAGASLAASVTDPSGAWTNGTATVTAKHKIERPAAATEPTTVTIAAKPVDADGVTMAPATLGDAALRFGRLRLYNASGSELLDLRVPVRAEYFDGGVWRRNSADTCTSIEAGSVALGNLRPATTSLAIGTSPAIAVTWANGSGFITLTPTARGVGAVDLVLNLGDGVATPDSCLAAMAGSVGGTAPTSGLTHLEGNWCGAAHDRAPSARLTFGTPKSRYIYLRERY